MPVATFELWHRTFRRCVYKILDRSAKRRRPSERRPGAQMTPALLGSPGPSLNDNAVGLICQPRFHHEGPMVLFLLCSLR